MKKNNKYFLMTFCTICGAMAIAFIVNILFKVKTDGIMCAEWEAGDALNYVGAMAGSISTFVLSLVAYRQNEKLKEMEETNYIASNSCMVLVDTIQIKPKANIPINYELHMEQILNEKDNEDLCPSGYSIEVNLKKVDHSMQAVPSLIYVSDCTLLVGDSQRNTLESAIWLKNVREGYTRVAILESGIAFNCSLLMPKNTQDKFEGDIKTENNKITLEILFNIITDKYVMTKCKCRAYCNYQNSGGNIIWKSEKAMVFFYGHELKHRNEIQVL